MRIPAEPRSGYEASFNLVFSTALFRPSAGSIVGGLRAFGFGRRLQGLRYSATRRMEISLKLLRCKKVRVAAHDHFGRRRNGAFQDAVVGGVSLDD